MMRLSKETKVMGSPFGKGYDEFKTKVHERLIDLLDLALIDTAHGDILKGHIRRTLERILVDEQFSFPLNTGERERLCQEIQDEVLGLGPLEPFMHDPTITDILVNTYDRVYVEKHGKLHLTEARFRDDVHLRKIIDRIVSAVGRRVDESCPMVDARLADGSRVNAIVPPLAIDGPAMSIRRFAVDPWEMDDLIGMGTLTPEMAEVVRGIIGARLNVLISGGTGTGKTTLLNVLSGFMPANERIVTIEDPVELQLKQDHVVRLEARPPNMEGSGETTQRDLLRNSLRMRPDRIIVGEVRGPEVLDMLQAMNTGHDGSLTTIHANSPREALLRLETLVAMAGLNMPNDAVRTYISSAIDVIIHLSRLVDGSRKVTSLEELVGMDRGVILTQEIFSFTQTGIDPHGKVRGAHRNHGVLPKFFERFRALAIRVPGMAGTGRETLLQEEDKERN
jgi:pilus assembly protein CpaF